jgi:hypothetical protein
MIGFGRDGDLDRIGSEQPQLGNKYELPLFTG